MTEEIRVSLTVNGRRHVLGVKPNTTLQNLIRSRLNLTGTKKGCELGECGACTVLMNGRPVNSCMVLAVEADGAEIVTIEGLAPDGDLHPLQKSFIKHGALQCGFCTPGMLLSAKALIDRHPDPTPDQIRSALGGNLCRCAAYPRIIEAVRSWREFDGVPLDTRPRIGAERDQERGTSVVGHSVTRYDAPDKVTGRAVYTADMRLPGMIYAKILTSPHPHALIRRCDVTRARALSGVVAALTADDVPDVLYGVSPARFDERILAKDRVRYVGDEVAVVAALDEETAERALRLIDVEYEPLPAVFDAEEAMREGAPLVHPEDPKFARNINTHVDWHFGDIERGFAEADHIRQERFTGSRTFQAPIEPHAALARWEHHGGKVTLWTSTQTPHYVQRMISRTLGIPAGNIRVIKPAVGGAFGGKAETTPLDFCAILLARRTGRPVLMKYDRREMFQHHRGRHKQTIDLKIGVKRDGTITAVESRILLDGGAYTSYGIITAYYAGAMIPTLYKVPNYRYEGFRMYTNLPACGAMRGHGVPQPRFAFESLLDMIAEDIRIDPIEIRIRNAMEPNTRTCNALDISSCEFRATLEKAREASGWNKKKGRLPRGRGIGVGCGGFVSGAGYPIYRAEIPHSSATIRVHEDGRAVSLQIAAAEIGQGSDTVLCQIAAEEMGIPYEWVWMVECDSVLAPMDLGSYASRVTLMAGSAVQMAASRVKEALCGVAARRLGCEPGALTCRDARIFITEQPDVAMEWSEAATLAFSQSGPVIGTGSYRPPVLGGDFKGGTVGTSPAFSFSTMVAEVDVDLETGFVKVMRCLDVSDSGTVINPMTFHGQVEGSIHMGLGEVLLEDVVHGPEGHILNPNLHDYLVPSMRETPEISSLVVDSYEPRGPFGAKEVGEGSILPVMGAIANAIHDATGVWVKELPITPERILRALKENRPADDAEKARSEPAMGVSE